MRIVIATAVYYPQINGVAVFSHNLAVGLASRGHEVMVICPSQTGKNYTRLIDGVKTVYLKSIDIKVYPDQIHKTPKKKKLLGIKLPKLIYKHGLRVSVFPQHEVRKVLDEFEPDIVHVQVSDPIGLSVVSYARKRGIPVVTTEHNRPEVITNSLKIGFLKKPANAVLASYFRNRQSKSDFVTMPTELSIRELLGDGASFPVPVAAISNGVDLSNFKPGKASSQIYEKYKIPQGVPIVLYVGRIDPEKKVELVISAFKKACKKNPKMELVLVGDGVERARLEMSVKDESGIRFLGRVLPPDLYELYKTGTVFITASPVETQGIVLIEAAATGLPLIAVNAGAVAEVCQDGENGILCRAGDTNEMAEAIVKIVDDEDLRTRLGKRSLEIASSHDFQKTLDRFINIYNRLVDNNR